MYSFRRFGSSSEPWFRVGNVEATTTVLVAAAAIVSMFVWAIEGQFGPIFRTLWLISENPVTGSVLEGQIWRLVTWPVPNEPDFWNVLLIAIFVILGSQLEGLMGRRAYTWLIGALVLIPAVLVTLLEAVAGLEGGVAGLRFVQLGILVAFAAQSPRVLFWPGIPAWILAGVIIVIDYLQILGTRNDYDLAMLTAALFVSLFGIRAFGYADEVPWIPRVPLPAAITGSATPQRTRPKRRGKRSRGNLSAVPQVDLQAEQLADMEIDALLDQVASEGLDSLTKAQRKRLEQHSRELRRRRDEA